MKTFVLSFLSIVFLNGMTLYASYKNAIELRSCAFFHPEQRFQEVYGLVGPDFGVELSRLLSKRYAAWIDVDYFLEKSHKSCCRTHLGVLDTSFGVKYVYPLRHFLDLYAGIGPAFSWVHLKNHTCCGREHFSKLAVGGVVKTGFYYRFLSRYFIDVFADYLYQPVHIGRSIEIGGVKLGLGVGSEF